MMPGLSDEQYAGMADQVKERMVSRVWFVGSSEQTALQIEATFTDGMASLAAHLADRKYLFGARPAFGDFGLWGQLYNAWTDPTAGEIVKRHPALVAWIERMLEPRNEGDFEPWSALEPTLLPFVTRFVGALFLPWSAANAAAIEAGDEEFTVELEGRAYTQKPQKYHARSLAALRARYAALPDRAAVDAALEKSGCLPALRG
jgi:hypothetical protein